MKTGALVLGLMVLIAPSAVAAEWVVVADDGAKQVLVDKESIQLYKENKVGN